jgi:hypothetical protein
LRDNEAAHVEWIKEIWRRRQIIEIERGGDRNKNVLF